MFNLALSRISKTFIHRINLFEFLFSNTFNWLDAEKIRWYAKFISKNPSYLKITIRISNFNRIWYHGWNNLNSHKPRKEFCFPSTKKLKFSLQIWIWDKQYRNGVFLLKNKIKIHNQNQGFFLCLLPTLKSHLDRRTT